MKIGMKMQKYFFDIGTNIYAIRCTLKKNEKKFGLVNKTIFFSPRGKNKYIYLRT